MTHLLEDSTNQITLHLPLIPGQRNCSVSIKSEGAGDVQQFIDTGQSEWMSDNSIHEMMISGYEYRYLVYPFSMSCHVLCV